MTNSKLLSNLTVDDVYHLCDKFSTCLRCSQLQNKSLVEANKEFLARHEGTSQIDYMV